MAISSTSFHIVVNVRSADYFHTHQLRLLYEEAKVIIQLNPTTGVTLANAATVEDKTLPSQQSGIFARLSGSNQQSHHSNCTTEYWLKNRGPRKRLTETSQKYDIGKATRSLNTS